MPVATFQVAQKYNNKVLAVWRLPLSQFIQSAFFIGMLAANLLVQENLPLARRVRKSGSRLNI